MKKYSIDIHWDVAKNYEVEANSYEDAYDKIMAKINKGDVCVWTDGFETTDDYNIDVVGEENTETHEIEYY